MVWTSEYLLIGTLISRLFSHVYILFPNMVGIIEEDKFVVCFCNYIGENVGHLLSFDRWSIFIYSRYGFDVYGYSMLLFYRESPNFYMDYLFQCARDFSFMLFIRSNYLLCSWYLGLLDGSLVSMWVSSCLIHLVLAWF